MQYSSLLQTQQAIDSGNATCQSIVEKYLSNINANKDLNVFLEVFEAESVARAKELDAKPISKRGSLYGMVIGIKDNICYKGHKVSAASKILENFESLFSSTAVERLLKEDAIIIGRINCDEFAMGSSNENSAYGNVLNAIDKERTPGGSSGGSAVAVQAGLCLASLGSDTGGSIRQPAAFCGVIGLKPTYGRISRHGLIAFASSFDQIGPFTNTIRDAQLLLNVMAGKDSCDATAIQNTPEYKAGNGSSPKKIAYFKEVIESEKLQPEIKMAVQQLIKKLKADGHTVEPVEFPLLKFAVPAYYVLTTAEASANLSRYDGVHFGFRSPNANKLDEVYLKSRSEGFGKEVKNRIVLGTFVLSSGYYDAYYTKAQKVRRLLKNRVDEIYKNYDFILSPTTPTTAFKLGEKTADPVTMYLEDIFTVTANLVGNPAISLPYGKDESNLPIGIQLMANNEEEQKLLDFSAVILNE